LDGADGALVPMRFVAVTVTVYETPFVRWLITQLNGPVLEHRLPPGFAVAVYPLMEA
jgi:hypothetical protein